MSYPRDVGTRSPEAARNVLDSSFLIEPNLPAVPAAIDRTQVWTEEIADLGVEAVADLPADARMGMVASEGRRLRGRRADRRRGIRCHPQCRPRPTERGAILDTPRTAGRIAENTKPTGLEWSRRGRVDPSGEMQGLTVLAAAERRSPAPRGVPTGRSACRVRKYLNISSPERESGNWSAKRPRTTPDRRRRSSEPSKRENIRRRFDGYPRKKPQRARARAVERRRRRRTHGGSRLRGTLEPVLGRTAYGFAGCSMAGSRGRSGASVSSVKRHVA
jgi:hypothetical protein